MTQAWERERKFLLAPRTRILSRCKYYNVYTQYTLLFGMIQKKEKKKKTDSPREGWEDSTPPPHRDFKEREECGGWLVLAVAHPNPWSSASFYLPSQSLADSRCNLMIQSVVSKD